MRLLPAAAVTLLLSACATERSAGAPAVVSAELGIFRAAELARVRCLVVAPFENASNVPLAADAATAALLENVGASGTRVFPVKELRALFRDTPVELPEGIPPGLAMELAQLVGADAAIYGTVEGSSGSAETGVVVSVRLALSPARELLYASAFAVAPRPGETVEAAVRRSLTDATHALFLRLGSVRGGTCFDRKRIEALRTYAVAQGAPPAPPRAPATPPAPPPPPPPVAPQAAAPSPRSVAVTPRQQEWVRQLLEADPFVVDDVAFAGRTAQLQRDSGLADLAVALTAAPRARLRIVGHVDATHDAEADVRLSQAMAQAAADRLTELGVPRARILVTGLGSESPRLPNFTARGRAANRRIEAVGLK
jgi:outer membrane protein OmpA-like peptidoglycan-associated protein